MDRFLGGAGRQESDATPLVDLIGYQILQNWTGARKTNRSQFNHQFKGRVRVRVTGNRGQLGPSAKTVNFYMLGLGLG